MQLNRCRRGLALIAVATLVLVGCGDSEGPDDEVAQDDGAAPDGPEPEAEPGLDAVAGDTGAGDVNDDVQDGVYRGNGVVVPVPEGWTLDPAAAAQGIIVAAPQDVSQQLSARAIDTAAAEGAGQPMDLDSLLDAIRQQIGRDADVDEEVELPGAERAHRLTYRDLPPREDGTPASSATIVLASDGAGLVGEFVYGAASESYDDAVEAVFLDVIGFDPDSQPPPMPQSQPAP